MRGSGAWLLVTRVYSSVNTRPRVPLLSKNNPSEIYHGVSRRDTRSSSSAWRREHPTRADCCQYPGEPAQTVARARSRGKYHEAATGEESKQGRRPRRGTEFQERHAMPEQCTESGKVPWRDFVDDVENWASVLHVDAPEFLNTFITKEPPAEIPNAPPWMKSFQSELYTMLRCKVKGRGRDVVTAVEGQPG